MSEPIPAAPPVLEAVGLSKSFRAGSSNLEVLRGAHLAVSAGESLSIRGESGSGKTTLLHCISGLERADTGTLLWRGREVSALPLRALAALRTQWLGMVFQGIHLLPELTVLDNILLAARLAGKPVGAARPEALRLLARVGLGGRESQLPATLSGGERQRVAVARALLNRPGLVLADEPTGNLDEDTGERILDLLLEVCTETGTALVLVTHNRGHARRCRRHLFLHLGQLGADSDLGRG